MKLAELIFETKLSSVDQVEAWLKRQKITGTYNIRADLSVDITGDFRLKDSISIFPVKFNEVSGNFNFWLNKLTSLKGVPLEIGGDFVCSNNELTSLEGAPRDVAGGFYCQNNHLTSLEGAPREVGGNFFCVSNQLTSLKGAPREVGGNFICTLNQLTSLKGAPREVGGDFICANNPKLPKDEKLTTKVAGHIIKR